MFSKVVLKKQISRVMYIELNTPTETLKRCACLSKQKKNCVSSVTNSTCFPAIMSKYLAILKNT